MTISYKAGLIACKMYHNVDYGQQTKTTLVLTMSEYLSNQNI